MRRIAALLVLLVFGLTQVRTLECPMASGADDGARHSASMADSHHAASHSHSHGHTPASHDEHGSPAHGPAACVLVMSCGAAAAPASGAVTALATIDLAAAPARLPYLYSSPVLNTDSPPPRGPSAA
jgi:hypothetical protein